MKKFNLTFLKSAIFSVVILLILPIVFSNRIDVVNASKESELQDEINRLEKKLNDAQNQVSSLSREINIIESNIELKNIQIRQANYQIQQKEEELSILQEDIGLLEVRLDRLDETIDYHSELLGKRIKQEYISKQYTLFEMLVSSKDISEFMSRVKYIQKVEAEDKELLKKMNSTKGNYETKQDLLEEKKSQVVAIKQEIENQKKQTESLRVALEQQKYAKDSLLRVTQNNEKKYANLLDDAKKELSQIQAAASVVVRTGTAFDVKKGEVIGTMGNSGFSSGAHLHFGVYNYSVEDFQSKERWNWYYSNYVDPLKMLASKTVKWDTGCYRDPKGDVKSGGGSWDWPMASVRITQNYGSSTCYNWMYGNKPHPALDIVGIGDISVRAVADGVAYSCRNCLKDGGNGVFVFHDGDKMTVYWHLR